MLTAIILLATFPGWSTAQDGEILLSGNKTQCALDMVQWCNKMQYSEGAGMTMESITYEDPAGSNKVFCSSDSDGTVCTSNDFPWFSCSPNKQLPPRNTFTYNGQVLTENITSTISAKLVDICSDADRALNDIFVQNLSYQNESLKEEVQQTFEAMFQQMSDMSDQIDRMQAQLDMLTLLFKKEVIDGLNKDVPLQSQDDVTTLSPYDTSVDNTSAYNTNDNNTSAYNTSAYNTSAYNTSAYNTSAYNTSAFNTIVYNTSVYNTSSYNTSAYNTSDYNPSAYNSSDLVNEILVDWIA